MPELNWDEGRTAFGGASDDMAISTTYNLETVHPEFRASTVTAGDQSLSNVVGLANGGYAVVYRTESGGDEFPTLEIYSSATDTTPITVNVTNGGTTDMVGEPVITELSNGTIAVTWKEGPAGDNKVVTTTVNATTGGVVAREMETGGHPDNTDPEVVALSGGRFAVVTDAGTGVNVFTYASDGSAPTAVFYAGIADPAVARLSDGRFAITYTTGAGDVRMRMFEASGVEVGGVGERLVSDVNASASQVAALKDGGFAVVFRDATFEGGVQPGIGLRLFTSAGKTGPVIRVDNDSPALEDFDPEIAVLDNGFIVVTYTIERTVGPTDTGVLTRIFDLNGNAVSVVGFGNNIPLDDLSTNDEQQTSVAALRSGQFVATWTDMAPLDTDGTGISATVRELVRTQIGSDDFGEIFRLDELRDLAYGTDGNDEFRLFGLPTSGEIVDGKGGAFDVISWMIGTSEPLTIIDFRQTDLSNVEQVMIRARNTGGETKMLFTATQAAQFDTVYFNAQATTTGHGQAVEVSMGSANTFSLSGMLALGFDEDTGTSDPGPKATFRIYGDGDAETITGSSIADTIDSGAGNDTLNGGLGRDTLRGGLGNDTYVLGAEASGIDAVQDSGGIDTITSTISRRLDFFDFSEIENLTLLGRANIAGTGNRLANTITGNSGRNTLDGGIGNDRLYGAAGNDRLLGGHGNDSLYGGDHNDTLDGGIGNDRLDGGRGNDILIGGVGRDTLTGGLHNDTFKFTNKVHSRGSTMDLITDFDDRGRGNDRIDVSALFGPRMKYIHDDAFTASGQVRIKDIAGPDVIVEVNTGGSLAADFAIRLKGTTLGEMSAGDFVL